MKKHIAVIGCGYWGKNLVRAFHELGVLSTICDENENVINAYAEKYRDIRCVKNVDGIFADTSINGIVIAVPASKHYEIAKSALLSGKDVFVEKPLALNLEDGYSLANIAKEKGLILMVGHILEYHPAIDKIREIIHNGELGKINYICSNRLSFGKIRREENILWSFAPHDISVILSILGKLPVKVSASGESYINPNVADITSSSLSFEDGVKAHIFVSWLHPFKEQKLVIVGTKKMLVFDDTSVEEKLVIYPHKVEWQDAMPVALKAEGEVVRISFEEPLKIECGHFLECITKRLEPKTGSKNGLSVLKVLNALEASLNRGGKVVPLNKKADNEFFAHETAVIDEGSVIGAGTKIWHFTHIMGGSTIGEKCNIGQNCVVLPKVSIGNKVKIQNNVSVYTGVHVEDGVFLGPSMVFTNVYNPRGFIERKNEYKDTYVKKGATIGANATVVCGHTIGEYSFIGAGAVVTKDVPSYALVYGNPSKVHGWVCFCGCKIADGADFSGTATCSACGSEFRINRMTVKVIEKVEYASASSGA
ncbi:MAG: Gfo/Idh/MocA family oxidoreductase [Deltaproteobacteria bacterium]|nr:Gfo/Idh/MocA family oxidoreductase [Deltaproteobacteria bacterium]